MGHLDFPLRSGGTLGRLLPNTYAHHHPPSAWLAEAWGTWVREGRPDAGIVLTMCQGWGWSDFTQDLLNQGTRPATIAPGIVPKAWTDLASSDPSATTRVTALALLCNALVHVETWRDRLHQVMHDPIWAEHAHPHLNLGGVTPFSAWLDWAHRWPQLGHPAVEWAATLDGAPRASLPPIFDTLFKQVRAQHINLDDHGWVWALARRHPQAAHAAAVRHGLPENRTTYPLRSSQLPALTQRLLDEGIALANPSVSPAHDSALACAVQLDALGWVEAWRAQGGDLNWQCPGGRNLLHLLGRRPNRGEVRGALHQTPTPLLVGLADKPDKAGQSPLHVACHRLRPALAEVLLRWGADPNRADKRGRRPLDTIGRAGPAARQRGTALLQLIDPDCQTASGWHQALRSFDVDLVAAHRPDTAVARAAAIDKVCKNWNQSAGRSMHNPALIAQVATVLDLLLHGPRLDTVLPALWSWALDGGLAGVGEMLMKHGDLPWPTVESWALGVAEEFKEPSGPAILTISNHRLADWAHMWVNHGMLLTDPRWSGVFESARADPRIAVWMDDQALRAALPSTPSLPPSRPQVRL